MEFSLKSTLFLVAIASNCFTGSGQQQPFNTGLNPGNNAANPSRAGIPFSTNGPQRQMSPGQQQPSSPWMPMDQSNNPLLNLGPGNNNQNQNQNPNQRPLQQSFPQMTESEPRSNSSPAIDTVDIPPIGRINAAPAENTNTASNNPRSAQTTTNPSIDPNDIFRLFFPPSTPTQINNNISATSQLTSVGTLDNRENRNTSPTSTLHTNTLNSSPFSTTTTTGSSSSSSSNTRTSSSTILPNSPVSAVGLRVKPIQLPAIILSLVAYSGILVLANY